MRMLLSLAVLVAATAAAPEDQFFRSKTRDSYEVFVPDWLSSVSALKARGEILERSPAEIEERAQQYAGSPYLNQNTKQFVVNGSGIPLIDFDIGESYAGLLPISDEKNETRKLYFWFFPSSNPNATDEIALWFNGGPGCSSLTGLIKEHGPMLYQPGTPGFTPNTYAWRNLTNIVYIEQPIGVGFTQGTPDVSNEKELAKQLKGFWKNFVDAFKLHKRKVYLTGESYAGFYVPYIANAFINAEDNTYFNLKGVAIHDPIIGDNTVQSDVIMAPFVHYWTNIFNFNDTFLASLDESHVSCGYADYMETYLQFPPPKKAFPVPPAPSRSNRTCAIYDNVLDALHYTSPCFNVYHITDFCPPLYNPEVPYFNRLDVQAAINAPVGTVWQQCTDVQVFPPRGDQSLGPAQDGVLQHVIESLNNVIIGVGLLDYILPLNGTLLALQNTTWNGEKGFQSYPGSNDLLVPYHSEPNPQTLAASGVVGKWGHERGLTFYHVVLAGHQEPQYAPGSSYRVIEKMLGRIESLDQPGPFSTQQ